MLGLGFIPKTPWPGSLEATYFTVIYRLSHCQRKHVFSCFVGTRMGPNPIPNPRRRSNRCGLYYNINVMTYVYRFPVKILTSDLITELREFVAVAPRVGTCAAICETQYLSHRARLGNLSSGPRSPGPL